MNITSKLLGQTLVLMPQGRIDHAASEAFSAALAVYLTDCKTGGTPLILDFSGIEYVSSIGLRALMLAARQVKAQSGQIAIAALTPVVREVFEVSRFNLIFDIFDRVDEAHQSFH